MKVSEGTRNLSKVLIVLSPGSCTNERPSYVLFTRHFSASWLLLYFTVVQLSYFTIVESSLIASSMCHITPPL